MLDCIEVKNENWTQFNRHPVPGELPSEFPTIVGYTKEEILAIIAERRIPDALRGWKLYIIHSVHIQVQSNYYFFSICFDYYFFCFNSFTGIRYHTVGPGHPVYAYIKYCP